MSKLRQLINDMGTETQLNSAIRKPITVHVSADDVQRLLQRETDPHLLTQWCRAWIELNKESK
jgi:hypothetical protein